ncbi:hypothetical protein J1605_010576 [Eschrichtius robustus]|uniref:Secreted protein n=1 Tax=Eschrichtius robustus TaxID=9764 RepID=A0AB34GRZ8_ESCRO|nr:hypothetical protein J1605_010576 [Eschrichtius robustus]
MCRLAIFGRRSSGSASLAAPQFHLASVFFAATEITAATGFRLFRKSTGSLIVTFFLHVDSRPLVVQRIWNSVDGKGGNALFFLCCGQAFWIWSPRGSTPTAATRLQRGTGQSYASFPLTGTSPDPVPRFSRFGVQKRWRGAPLRRLAIGVFTLRLEVQL